MIFALGKVESPYLVFPLWYLFLSIVCHWNSSINCYIYIYMCIYNEFGFFLQYTVPTKPVDKAVFFDYYKLNIWYFIFTSISIERTTARYQTAGRFVHYYPNTLQRWTINSANIH